MIFAVSALFRPHFLRDVTDDLAQASPLVRLFFSMVAIGGGLAIVLTHNVWVAGWPLIITLIGWGGLIKGVLALVRPQSLILAADVVYGSERRAWVTLVLAALFGAYLTAVGFGCL